MPATKPEMTVIGTNGQNLWVAKGLPKQAIVLHIMEGSLAGCDQWFSNPAAQASANYGVGKDGTIHQYVDPEGADAPFANGLINMPAASVVKLTKQFPQNPNYWTVSIEHEGQHGTPTVFPPAQLHASASLTAWLCQRFNIPLDEDHLLGHYEFDSVTRANCPGLDRGGWVAYEALVQSLLGGPQPGDPDLADLALAGAAIDRIVARRKVKAGTPVPADRFRTGAP